MVDVKKFNCGLKLSWIRLLSSSNKKYLCVVKESYPFLENFEILGTDYISPRRNRIDNPFWKDIFCCYQTFSQRIKPNTWGQFLQPVFGLTLIFRSEEEVCFIRVGLRRELELLMTYLTIMVVLLSFRVFSENYNVQAMFLEYEGLLAAVRNYLAQFSFRHMSNNGSNPLCPLIISIILSQVKGSRKLYDILMKTNTLPNSTNKWQRDLNNNQYIYNWKWIYSLPYRITKDTHLHWLQARLVHRILPTKYLLTKMNILNDNLCSFCSNEVESLVHLFCNCNCIKTFWEDLFAYIANKCNLQPITWAVQDILFGHNKLDSMLNKIILQAKSFIYKSKFKNTVPTIPVFLKHIRYMFLTEKIIAKKNLRIEKFNKEWDKYRILVETAA